jgi:glycosyltransferase involved in cell wall biosynthesis
MYRGPAVKIGIDATIAASSRMVGIARFIVNLVDQLARLPDQHTYYLWYRLGALKRPHRIWRPPDARFRVRMLREPFNRALFRRLDVFHATSQRLPRYDGLVPYVGSLHDIYYLSEPTMGSPRTRAQSVARYRDVARRSRLIMTLSEYSQREIVRLLGVDPGRVRVVPLAADPAYVPQTEGAVSAARTRYGLSRRYVLFGGGFGRRKNAAGALRAFATALPRLPADVDIALSGGAGPREAEVRAVIRDADLDGRVHQLGFVPDADYPALMTGSVLYFFPSLLEGFGLPALEAMACGVPVVTSSTTSLPEVCGDAARLVNPARVEEMADALVEVVTEPTLRAELRRRGLARAAQFSWRAVAGALLSIYREAC